MTQSRLTEGCDLFGDHETNALFVSPRDAAHETVDGVVQRLILVSGVRRTHTSRMLRLQAPEGELSRFAILTSPSTGLAPGQ